MGSGSSLDIDVRLNTELGPEDRALFQDSRRIQELLRSAKSIAIVGLSTEPTKASNMVASYLKDEGFEVVPIHPKATEILGQKVYPSLKELDRHVDVVVVFRPASEVSGIAQDFLKTSAHALWMQLRIIDLDSARLVMESGRLAVVDRCIKMEHGRYAGALHWAGMNTEVISARRRKWQS
jgi:uncharacterized protein